MHTNNLKMFFAQGSGDHIDNGFHWLFQRIHPHVNVRVDQTTGGKMRTRKRFVIMVGNFFLEGIFFDPT